MRKTAIIVAAGGGTRMGSDRPKQFMDINGKPMICYSLDAYEKSDVTEIIIVTGSDDIDYVKDEIVAKYGYRKVTRVVSGGDERYKSVYQGLLAMTEDQGNEERIDDAIEDADIVLIHDAARPMITAGLINNAISETMENTAAALAVKVKDTIRKENGNIVPRDGLYAMQTPQCFEYDLIREAYDKLMSELSEGPHPEITDDVQVLFETLGLRTKLIEGSYRNIKVTTPDDRIIAEAYLK